MSQQIRIAIVEDDSGLRDVLQTIFGSAPDFKVVFAAADAESALRELTANDADVVLMDINLPGMSGIDCLREIKKRFSGVRVVMVTVYDDDDRLFESLVAGADGYLLKRTTRQRLLESVREIVNGGAPMSPKVARRIVEYFHDMKTGTSKLSAPAVAPGLEGLTGRETEVLAKLAEGLAPKEVASELDISWETVRNHIANIYSKLHVHSRSEAILKYLGRSRSRA